MPKTTMNDLQHIIDGQEADINALEKQIEKYKKVIESMKNLIDLVEPSDGC